MTNIATQTVGDLTIRPAFNRDGDGIADLIALVFADYPGCVFDREAEFPELDAIVDDFKADDGRIWVAVDDRDRILGCFGVKYDATTREGELHKVYLHPAARGRGMAQKLMAKALAWLGQTHPECATVMLWTDTRFEAGHRFYEKCGFARTGESRILDDLSNSSELQFRFDFAAYQKALPF
ncbi:GNAT family N-acetyltransferase [Thalassospira sp. UBA6510]|uniref:GNAT family N-acetyltransferase n=1 Tax=Thalassospira sp. UBA6510 TaxID=1947676 RepID=UPI000ED6150F|nr:GNAT family N-acetyltransferase [Thalassospira sp. UBA6510]HAI32907.1 N-acetyltransferase [Thalassospira sp.]|tara:strand:+ start:13092 stop:13634 length:543 start_codon:yes stop_codon:yes gene_type:complete